MLVLAQPQVYCCNRADPFRVILEFQLARMLEFCLWPKKGNPKFFEIGFIYLLPPGLFLNCASQNILISIEIEPLELDM